MSGTEPPFAANRRQVLAGLSAIALLAKARSAAALYPVEVKTLVFTTAGGKDLSLDLYLPQGASKPSPVIVFLHGGGWFTGTTKSAPDLKRFFAQAGYAMASVEYRLTPDVTFPSNLEDVKTAIRWLRANASSYGLNSHRLGLWGTSAGGHLAAMAALTPDGLFSGADLPHQSSRPQCVLDAYGPSLLSAMDAEAEQESASLQPLARGLLNAPPIAGGGGPAAPTPPGPGAAGGAPVRGHHDDATSPESRLLGAPIQSVPEKVRAASPLTYVGHDAPPFLLMHGMADNTVPHEQSVLLYRALAAAGNEVTLRLIDGLPHTFFNRSDLDELAGPFRMDVTESHRGKERTREETAGVFNTALKFFDRHLA